MEENIEALGQNAKPDRLFLPNINNTISLETHHVTRLEF